MKRLEQHQQGNTIRLNINGPIDESFKFPDNLSCELLIVDFEGATLLNSMGIRIWLQWSRNLKNIANIKLENCRQNFIDQVRYLRDIIPSSAEIDSFYVSFYDPETDKTTEVKMVRGKDYDANGFTVPKPLNEKGKPLELDVVDSYFDFLKQQK